MSFAENLKKARKANGFTCADLSHLLGIEESAYRNYESGLREMPLRCQEKASDVLGVELVMLYSEDEKLLDNILTCAFRIESADKNDIEEIANFKRIVKNYLKMEALK